MKKLFFIVFGFLAIVCTSCKKKVNDPCWICTDNRLGYNSVYEVCNREACINNTSCLKIDDDMTHEEWARNWFGSSFSSICRQQ